MTSKPLLTSSGTKLVAIVSALALALAGGGTYIATTMSSNAKSKEAEIAAQESKKEEVMSIGALGRLEPAGEIFKIAPPAVGFSSRIEKLLVKEGDKVKPGQPIAVMDSYQSLLASAKQAEASMFEAQSNLENVRAGAKSGDIGAQRASIGTEQAQGVQAEAEVRRAQADYQSVMPNVAMAIPSTQGLPAIAAAPVVTATETSLDSGWITYLVLFSGAGAIVAIGLGWAMFAVMGRRWWQ